jgi:hypothetical protein
VLHLASLFTEDEPLPPVISFAMGTLGFLTPFNASMVGRPGGRKGFTLPAPRWASERRHQHGLLSAPAMLPCH